MPQFILHHYDNSPFSQKVRWLFGMKGLAWQSVEVPSVMPKPDVVALTGGYRRTPFLQVGADVYCDTALMCRVIDTQVQQPALYPVSAGALQHLLAQWADSTLFWAAIPYAMQPAGAPHLLKGMKPEEMQRFATDRAAMNAGRTRLGRADTGAALAHYLPWLDDQLAHGQPYLLGLEPCIADLSVAHSIWFLHRAGPVAEVLAPFARLQAWYARIAAFGEGSPQPLSSAEALQVAATASGHAAISVTPGLGFAAGDAVTIAAADYATDAVTGTLVGLNVDEAVIERRDERAGTVHVHFPRIGYTLRKSDT